MTDDELNKKLDEMNKKFDEMNSNLRNIAIGFEKLTETMRWLK